MEAAQKRVIQINPDFFKTEKPARKSRRAAASGTTPRRKTAVRNSLKQQLLQKIRNKYHQESGAAAPIEMDEDADEDEFQKSLRFFETTLAAAPPPPAAQPIPTQPPIQPPTQPTYNVAIPAVAPPPPPPIKYTDKTYEPPPLSTAPNYGCLKNGELPTYRKWSLSQPPTAAPAAAAPVPIAAQPNINGFYYTPPNIIAPPAPAAHIHPMVSEVAAARSAEIAAQHYAAAAAAAAPTVLCKTTKRQFTVGKSKTHPRISVLLPNKTIRKRIMTETQKINTIPITKIKQYLQKRGLIKVGSTAPNHILRKMYESSMLVGGDIVNHNPDVLMYNFLRGDKESEPI